MESFDSLANPGFGRGSNLSSTVDDMGNRGTGYTGKPGNIVDGSDNRPPSSSLSVYV